MAAQPTPSYGEAWAHCLQEYQSATVAEINALARSVLAADQLCQLVVRPK